MNLNELKKEITSETFPVNKKITKFSNGFFNMQSELRAVAVKEFNIKSKRSDSFMFLLLSGRALAHYNGSGFTVMLLEEF